MRGDTWIEYQTINSMIRNPFNFFYGSIPAEFESKFSLDESIRRLERMTKRTSFGALTSQAAVGRVTERRVILKRSIPFISNSFKPFFVGRLKRTRHGIILEGRFTMHWLIKAFLTYWFGFCLVWTALASYAVLVSQTAEQWWFPLAGIAMFGMGFCIVQTGKFFSRNDREWLSNVIRSALSSETRPDS